ncbi:MAG: BatD family protein, partial [Planctomycetota bacterium]
MRPPFSILIDMQPARRILVMFLFLTIALSTTDELLGQKISAKISSREAWVGAPLILQVTIYNAQEYQLPDDFEIDGCQVDIAGQPSQASQITIINGRRSVNKSVTINYLIVPEREGEFEIPRLEFEVDGETEVLKPLSFSAVQSETGDLLFAEVEGKKQKVYVGQPLDLKLKIWIKPFVDRQRRIKLTEGNMWSLISEQTSWGIFSDRMQELATSRQRPAAEVVRRKDSNAQAREYYLYEVEATVYPTKPGTIDASDLRLVVNYPLELGRSRDPFDSLFGGSMGRGSLLQQMMNDDMFDSPFSSRMSISKSRPITAKVEIDSTEILPIPTANQPKDYRGAVGKYQIETEVEQTSVAAGDPIILRMSVSGDGPMDLIQAPPLADIESLTEDFQITDQSLAGFVQGKSKFFVTTIRPRNESVQQIPEIPFSYFDPELEEYRTAYSQPIEINVQKAESLQLDAIVSNQKNTATTSDSSAGIGLDLANRNEFSVLTSDKFEIRIWTSI